MNSRKRNQHLKHLVRKQHHDSTDKIKKDEVESGEDDEKEHQNDVAENWTAVDNILAFIFGVCLLGTILLFYEKIVSIVPAIVLVILFAIGTAVSIIYAVHEWHKV